MPQAPHQCPSADNAGHVCDSSADILYPFASASSTLAGAILDIDHDDYYGHSGSWWDVQDSRWLIHLPQHALTVALAGAGTVGIPGGFACTSTCSTTWDDGLTVSLSAEPGPGQRFAGWSGACTGVGPCSLTLTADTSVTATFVPAVSKLSVAVAGRGRVTSSPAGISCPGRCSASFPDGRTVALRAAAARGFRFAGWTGACGGKGRCAVTLDGDRAVRAVFRKKA